MVETILDIIRLLADILLLLAFGNSGGLLKKTLFLLDFRLRTVLVQKLESLSSGIAVQGVVELSERRGNFEAEVQDLLLALKTDIFGPLDETRQIALGLDILANAEVARALFKKRVLW